MKKICFIGSALILILVLVVSGCAPKESPGREIVTIELTACGPMGSGPYLWSVTASEMLRELHPWLRASVEETMGEVEAFKVTGAYPPERKSLAMMTGSPIQGWEMALAGKPPYERKYTDLRFMAQSGAAWWNLSTYNPEIKSPQDLIGKRIAMCAPGSGVDLAMRALLDGWGILDQVRISYHSPMDFKDLLVTGVADAAFSVYNEKAGGKWGEWAGTPWTLQVLTARDCYWIGPTQENVEKMNATNLWKTGLGVVPKGALGEGVPSESFTVLHSPSPWACWDVTDDEIVYEMVKLLDENAEEFTERTRGDPMGGQWMTTFPGLTEDRVHPAALRYYNEQGYKIVG